MRDEFVNHSDLFMTLLDFASALPTEESSRPGKSYKSILLGANDDDWQNIYHGEYGTTRVIRDERYKLVLRYDWRRQPLA